ncbi:uncharacterized protein HMPREF1541_05828 [Cyphellophora europaea CBS 101466]|uniref:RING-type domain-containing protein n=1 Tax=Cyphellophora europaea (strain CBS 101466) TaxID=1220924 RepID=W2RT16_CYPE1|nr:uncharacterized protein HMPREF1541_05828 [Cyphellophora europaea CBS 101466]ETN39602.1 hypothetical protein HMPREF1541_05828 [Cyphellophora europaea CBS 101466]
MTSPNPTPATGLLNLEKELICFICTEVLYQPLTLIDCLHTFCGSCLKEWFSHQHRKASHSHSHTPNLQPYTCPTCRASVKDAQHNAMINTLLEMFLAANPNRARSGEEKEEMAKVYKSGDNILPKVDGRRRERRRREQDDHARRERREAEEARERSLREVSGTSSPPQSASLLSPRHAQDRSRSRSGSRDQDRSTSHDHDERRERRIQERARRRDRRGGPGPADDDSRSDLGRSEGEEAASSSLSPPLSSPRHPDAVEARQRGARTVAHQASLRSLVSASDSGTGTGDSLDEAHLMQEILAEGLLDGIDVDQLTEAQQDELSEIIAQRYRELHPRRGQRPTSSPSPGAPQPSLDLVASMGSLGVDDPDGQAPRWSTAGSRPSADPRPANRPTSAQRETMPPTSYTVNSRDQVRTTSETQVPNPRRASDLGGRPDMRGPRSTHPGVRSATDLSNHPRSEAPDPRQLSSDRRVSTEPRGDRRSRATRPEQTASPPEVETPASMSPTAASAIPTVNEPAPSLVTPRSVPQQGPAEVDGTSAVNIRTEFEEPSISCYRCNRKGIQYEVYKHCSPCNVDLCLRCYRSGRGCNHWFGFGHAALTRFDASHPQRRNQAMELPHLLFGRQFQRPPSTSVQTAEPSKTITTSDPASRLQEGHFCDHCGAFANACYWSCDYCNDGEWGFCNDCVNTHHCCSHALLPIAHKLFAPGNSLPRNYNPHTGSLNLTPADAHASFTRPLQNRSSPAHSAPSSVTSMTDASTAGPHPDYVNLSITTHCDICASPIPPSDSRYHCPMHPTPTAAAPTRTGDYDVCTSCYHNLIKIGRIAREDGPAGWRKCPTGHRMIITVFEASAADSGGQRRVILHDLVGGLKMSDEDIAAWQSTLNNSSAPPSSFNARGQWTWRDPADPAENNTRRSRSRKSTLLPSAQEGGNKTSRFPPNGGFGKVSRALWSYYPEEGEEGRGELLFPKGAVITEMEDINEEWSEGVYAGERGLVPLVYVREV